MNKGFYKELSEMTQEAIHALDEFERTRDAEKTGVFDLIRRVAVPCLDGTVVKQSILNDLPLREHIVFTRAVFLMANLRSLSGPADNQGIRNSLVYLQDTTNALSKSSKNIDPQKIFYSWQATLPGSANRSLIRASLEKAIAELNQEVAIEGRDEVVLDSDTSNTPGSPDIIRTILNKLDQATIFVADVTLVGKNQSNSNVMFELGYAIKSISESKIILIHNEHYGSPRDLPFDLGLKRAMLYRCAPDEENKADIRKQLATRIKAAIEAILSESSSD